MKKNDRDRRFPLLTKTIRIMKVTSLCNLLAVCSISASTYAQSLKFSIHKQNSSISEVIKEIEKKSDFTFFFNDNQINVKQKVNVSANNASIEDVLAQVLQNTGYNYQIIDKQILIKVSDKEVMAVPVVAQSGKKITGTVLDATGMPVIGANVLVKGTTNGTITDIDGKFSLEVSKDAILVVSYIGFASQEIKVGNQTNLSIAMKEDTEALDEVVVVGYGTQKKVNLTGAVSEIKATEFIEDRPITQLGQSLQGKVAGLVVSKSNGKPGAGYSFNVRGTTSLNGGGPLVLVDGVEMDANTIPPEDIESVSILKDAASAAIYGARAAFGVVLITTKSGEFDKKVQVSYSNNLSWSTPTDLPEKVDPETQIKMGGYAWGNKSGAYDSYWGHSVGTWLDLYKSTSERNTYRIVDGVFYPLGSTDLIKDMTETGFLHRHNVSVNGGSKKVAYHISAGLMNQDGVLTRNRDKYSRKNISLKLSSNITDWLSVQASSSYITNKSEFPYIPNGEYYLYSVSYLRPTFWLTGINDKYNLPYGYSPQIIDYGDQNYNLDNNYNLQLMTSIKPVKGLELNARYTYRRTDGEKFFHQNSYQIVHPMNGGVEYYKNEVNYLQRDDESSNYQVFDLWGQYEKSFGNHNFRLMLGYNQELYTSRSFFAKGEKLVSDNVPSLDLSMGNTYVGDDLSEWSTRSGFFRFNYNYKEKYLLEVVNRYDGSSKFRKDSRFVYLPSASLGWRVSEESFMDWSDTFLDNLKLRASYGIQGNQSISPYAFIPTYGTGLSNWIVAGKKAVTITPRGIVNDNFTWEEVKNLNLGVDLGLFSNRLTSTFEWYSRKTEGMLMPGEVLPGVLGTSVPKENAADLRVNGWELSVNWNDQIGDFSYNVGFNLYDYRTKIVKFANPTGLYTSNYEGQYLGEIWGYETDRFFTEDDFIVDSEGNRKYKDGIPNQDIITGNRVPMPGDVKYKDLNNDGKIDYGNNTLENPGDKRIIGNSSPRYQFGVNMGAQYKGFDMSLFFQGVGKRDLWISNSLIFAFSESYESLFKHTMDFWTPENTDAYYPRPIADWAWNRQVQTKYLQNAAYVRLKNLTIGYSLPKSLLSKLYLSKLRLFVSAENLLTFTPLPKGIDPEIGGSHTYPFAKEISFGVDIKF